MKSLEVWVHFCFVVFILIHRILIYAIPYKYKRLENKNKIIHLTKHAFYLNISRFYLQNSSNVDHHPNPHILLGRPPVVPTMGRFGAGCKSSTLVVTSTHWDPRRQMFWRADETAHGATNPHPSVLKVFTFQSNLFRILFFQKSFTFNTLYYVEVAFSLY